MSKYREMRPRIIELIQSNKTLRQAAILLDVPPGGLSPWWKLFRQELQAERDKAAALTPDPPTGEAIQNTSTPTDQSKTDEGLNAETLSPTAQIAKTLGRARISAANLLASAANGEGKYSSAQISSAEHILKKYGDMEPDGEDGTSTYERYNNDELIERLSAASEVLRV